MEENLREETTEVLENTSTVPTELDKYLEADENALSKIEEVLSDLDKRTEDLNNKKIESERNFEDRLAEFKEMLEKEKEDTFNDFAKQEQEIDAEKSRVEKIKLDEQGNQVNYIDSLKNVYNEFSSKISSIEDAIKACSDNDTLAKALEEEKDKLEKELSKKYDERKKELNSVLEEVGINKKVDIEEKDNDLVNEVSDSVINLDVATPIDNKVDLDIYDDNEVVSHEPREDVINEIYQSEEVMEGQVFPYLKALRGE